MRRLTSYRLRVLTIAATIVVVMLGAGRMLSVGTLSAPGVKNISAICPLGYLEVAVASRSFIPRLWIPLVFVLLFTVLLGRVFCAWMCPVSTLGFRPSRKKGRILLEAAAPLKLPILNPPYTPTPVAIIRPTSSSEAKHGWYHRLVILGAVLASSALFGFPVFCLICPIGLIFGSLFGVVRLFRFNEPAISLLVFPTVLLLELFVLRKWCGRFCPLGALLSLVSSLNIFFRPHVNSDACLMTKGTACGVCEKVCPENIQLHVPGALVRECTKCRDCAENCPVEAITFPWWRRA